MKRSKFVPQATNASAKAPTHPKPADPRPIAIPEYLLEGNYTFNIGRNDDGSATWFVACGDTGLYQHTCRGCGALWTANYYPHAFCPHCGAKTDESEWDYIPKSR